MALYPEFHDPTALGPANHPNVPLGVYLIGYDFDQPIGMAAHRPINESTTEVRRMYVLTCARRLGVARALLEKIEEHACLAGFSRLVLETGNRQLPAMKLYETYGFTRIEPFGDYKDDPTNVCYSKFIPANCAGAA